MLKSTFLYFVLISLLALSCNKDKTDSLNITKHKWKLKSVTINSETFKPNDNENRYVLEFLTDSTISLNLSINNIGGKFEIFNKGKVSFVTWGITKLCCDNDFDKKVLDIFPKVISYTVIGNILTLKINNDEIEFKRKL